MNPTILLVEDDVTAAKLVKLVLRQEGYRVIIVDNGPEALRMVEETEPALILLDIMLPGMDGFEVCRHLRSVPHTAKVPVIMFTSLDRPADQRRGFAVGADDYIVKPVKRDQLLDKVRGTLFFTEEAPAYTISP